MKVLSLADVPREPATLPGCLTATVGFLAGATGAQDLSVDLMSIAAGGFVPSHPGRRDQTCTVVSGSGWASGADGVWIPIGPGDTLVWPVGEDRGWRSDVGLTMLSIRAHGLLSQPES
ncbi:cupin domain-containing protein [Paractinoplanes rishiriensis]|uniref:Uncharacterized protein n=1 Tax=Paractinoplanes rishiriensis TaxID=1050105 RepID=A0A919MX11_9ACTN|nr:hypothetical protein [Actinoplanes rishiriensis]GIE95225.1 hypothetical protein Ari01nite_26900 [Actinoplanes rishiriensis]